MSKENIGDVIAKTLEGEPPATVTQARTLDQIAADIVRKDQQVGLGLISIGNDLIEAKERVEHGKWREWLDLNVGYSERKAQMCMQVARRYGSNPQLVADLGIRKVTALMLLPSGEDAEFLETHDVPNMSTRELEQAIRERDEAKAAAEAAAIHAGQLQRELDDERQTVDRLLDSSTKYEETNAALVEDNKELAYKLRQTAERVKDLESAPKEVYQDEAAIRKAADEAREAMRKEMQIKLDEARDQAALAVAEAEQLRRDAAELLRRDAAASVAPMITPMWYTGLPTVVGRYYCRFNCDGMDVKQIAEWDEDLRLWRFLNDTRIEATCTGWWPLPEEDE